MEIREAFLTSSISVRYLFVGMMMFCGTRNSLYDLLVDNISNDRDTIVGGLSPYNCVLVYRLSASPSEAA